MMDNPYRDATLRERHLAATAGHRDPQEMGAARPPNANTLPDDGIDYDYHAKTVQSLLDELGEKNHRLLTAEDELERVRWHATVACCLLAICAVALVITLGLLIFPGAT